VASGNVLLLASLVSTRTPEQEQYVDQSKKRALALLAAGRIRDAVASMMVDMREGPNCEVPHRIHAIGIVAVAAGDAALARAYIEGFA
jgi:hypothetical protein